MKVTYKYGGKTGGGGESDDDNSITDGKFGGGGSMYQNGGTVISGQNTSTVRTEQAPDGSTREYVWYDSKGNESVMYDEPDGAWEASGAIKVYGNWNEYAQGQTEKGEMFLPDESFPIMEMENGQFVFDESRYEGEPSGLSKAAKMRSESTGGPSNTEIEDLLERLGAAPSPTKFNMGGLLSMDSFTGVTGPDSTMLKAVAMEMAGAGAAGLPKEKLWGPHEKEMTPAQKIGALSTGGPSASRVEDLLERLMSYGRYR
jgi:hypothetical protein